MEGFSAGRRPAGVCCGRSQPGLLPVRLEGRAGPLPAPVRPVLWDVNHPTQQETPVKALNFGAIKLL